MEINNVKPATVELASLSAAESQSSRFKERKLREASSDVRNDAVYFSPVIRIDRDTQAAVIQYRDEETGEVKNEYPSHDKTDAYVAAQKTAEPEVREVKVIREDAPEAEVKEPHVDEEA